MIHRSSDSQDRQQHRDIQRVATRPASALFAGRSFEGSRRKDLEELSSLRRSVRELKSHPSRREPYVRELKNGELRIDRSRVQAEERLDGKYLLSTTDPSLSAEDVALGYKQLAEVERTFRTLKSTLDLRPLYHRLPERIEVHYRFRGSLQLP